jgi:hypothetical protein
MIKNERTSISKFTMLFYQILKFEFEPEF